MDNMNINDNQINEIKKRVDSGDISGAISQISPEMIANFSKMFSNMNNHTEQSNGNNGQFKNSSTNNNALNNHVETSNSINGQFENSETNNNPMSNHIGPSNSINGQFGSSNTNNAITNLLKANKAENLNNIDINTIAKITSTLNNSNSSSNNDPRKNLLNSLKPYLRDSKKEKLDDYMNLLNVTGIIELMKGLNKNN